MRLLIASLFLLSTSAMACPELMGIYKTCRSTTGESSGSSDLEITQRMENGVTIYEITSTDDETQERTKEIWIADGQVRTQTETSPEVGDITISTKVTCQGAALLYEMAAKAQGMEFLKLNGDLTKADKVLTNKSQGHVFGIPVQETLICE